MLGIDNRISLCGMRSYMKSHSVSPVKDLNGISRCAYIYSFPDQVKRNRIFVKSVRDQIIISHLHAWYQNRRFIGMCRQRLQVTPFFFEKTWSSAAISISVGKCTVIQLLQLKLHRFGCFLKRKEVLVAKCCQYPSGCVFNTALCMAFVLRRFHTARNDGCVIILCQLLVATVQHRFIPCVQGNTGFQIVRNQ